MSSAAFDTLRFARTLRDKGKFSGEQAEGLVDAMAEAPQGDIATKSDVAAVRTDLAVVRGDLRETELRLKAEIGAKTLDLKADLEAKTLSLKADIHAMRADIIKWMFGTTGFQTIVILGAAIALARSME